MTRRRRSQGIGALDDDDLLEPDAAGESGAEGGEGDGEGDGEGGARLVWSEHAHGGAVNCLAARGDLLASASRCGPAGGGRERPRGEPRGARGRRAGPGGGSARRGVGRNTYFQNNSFE